MRRLVALAGILFALFLPIGSSAYAANESTGLGGGFQPGSGSVLPAIAGQTTTFGISGYVVNVGSKAAEITLKSTLPTGLSAQISSGKLVLIQPKKSENVAISLVVGQELAPGDYPVSLILSQTNIAQIPGQAVFAPGIEAKYTVHVVGTGIPVTVNAVSENDGRPMPGHISLMYLDAKGNAYEVMAVDGSSLVTKAVPGHYRAVFTISNITSSQKEFDVPATGEANVTLRVKGVGFVVVSAVPITKGDKTVAAKLRMDISNTIAGLKGPFKLFVDVKRNGTLIDTVSVATLPELPAGISEQATTYVPDAGFKPGQYEFIFKLEAPTFKITSTQTSKFLVKTSLITWLIRLAELILAIGIIVAVVWWIRRRNQPKPVSSHRRH